MIRYTEDLTRLSFLFVYVSAAANGAVDEAIFEAAFQSSHAISVRRIALTYGNLRRENRCVYMSEMTSGTCSNYIID